MKEQPLSEKELAGPGSFYGVAQSLADEQQSFIAVTVAASQGHAPGNVGAKAIFDLNGLRWGTIGGGRLEAKAADLARDWLEKDSKAQTLLLHWDLQKDVGMTCGGSVSLLFEPQLATPWSIAIFGAGHVSQALCRLLLNLDVTLSCFDPRADWLERLPQHPKLRRIHCQSYDEFCDDLRPKTDCVVLTQGHATDLPVLQKILTRDDLGYIGVIGSRVKARRLQAALSDRISLERFAERVHCPMGLVRKTYKPAEIAVSIAAELLQCRASD